MDDANRPATNPLITRPRGKLLALFVATLLGIYATYLLAQPFLPAIVWSVTLAVVTHRFQSWLMQRLGRPATAAGVGVAVVGLAFVIPLTVLGYLAAREIGETIAAWQDPETQEQWEQRLNQYPSLRRVWAEVSKSLGNDREIPRLLERAQTSAASLLAATSYVAVQGLLTLFFLFYLYRDEERAIESMRRLMPLGDQETDDLFRRVADTIHATIYGTVVVAMLQGALGGLMFFLLGIPGAVLWGLVMAGMAIIPYLGAFVIWGPAAVLLALQGEWTKAVILTCYGTLAIGLIDNLTYPVLVGQRLRQHTVTAFIAILGGVTVFGATGLVLGPVIVGITAFLLEVWRRRTAPGATAERA